MRTSHLNHTISWQDMGRRTAEEPLPVEETYRELLREAVAKLGSQRRAARLVGVNQATISRTLEDGSRASYTTLVKLHAAIPELPSPIVPIRDAAHEAWCKLGGKLQAERPVLFEVLLKALIEASVNPDRAPVADTETLLAVVRDPIVRRDRSRR